MTASASEGLKKDAENIKKRISENTPTAPSRNLHLFLLPTLSSFSG